MHHEKRACAILAAGFLLIACGGGDSKKGSLNEGGNSGSDTDSGSSGANGTLGGGGGMPSTGGSSASGGNPSTDGTDAGAVDAGGEVDASTVDASATDAGNVDAGDASSGCEVGVAQNPAAPGTLDLFGQISFFADGQELPAGNYRVTYVDGCMKYASAQDWTIHAYQDGSIAWFIGTAAGDKLQMLPGTVGIAEGAGGFADFDACVAANKALPPIEFAFTGGALGIWLADSFYGDNVTGVDGRNPSWRLERLGSCQ